MDRPARTTYPENGVFSTLRDHTTGAYDALDRFNRPIRSRWNRTRGSNQVPFYDTTVHWDAGSNVTGVTDHVFGEFSFVYANDALDRLVGSRRGTGSGVSITGLIEQEDWLLSKVGNWAEHDLELTGDDPPSYSTDPDDGEFQAVAEFSEINETTLIKRDRDNDGFDMSEEFTRVYDSNGNLISDPEKGHTYKWDVLGRLMEIRGASNALVAEFRYNALGHRIAERIAAEGADWTRLVYDARWRVVATYKIDVSEDEEALRERFVYHAAGLDGVGTGSYIDALILRDRDADGNGSLEERHYYAQSWRHDVVAVIDHQGRQIEHMRYTPYGVPISIPASDVNRDGVLDADDLTLQAAAIGGPYSVVHDLDLDGDVDVFDLFIASAQHGVIGADPIGRGVLSSYGHRAGYAGYQWTPAAGLYHVRHRWYDPLNGTWISMDPAGYVDGANLFEYLASSPLDDTDAMGLWRGGGHHGNYSGFGVGTSVDPTITKKAGDTAITIVIIGVTAATALTPIPGDEIVVVGAASKVVTVSRWGRPGLRAGDWVMKGRANLLNYLRSGKIQPGLTNRFASPLKCQSFKVPPGSLKPPGNLLNPINAIKWILGQRRYRP